MLFLWYLTLYKLQYSITKTFGKRQFRVYIYGHQLLYAVRGVGIFEDMCHMLVVDMLATFCALHKSLGIVLCNLNISASRYYQHGLLHAHHKVGRVESHTAT